MLRWRIFPSSSTSAGGSLTAVRCSSAIALAGRWAQAKEGKETHGKPGLGLQMHEGNSLMHIYVKSGRLEDARHVFDSMPKRNVVSWNIMIQGYANNEEGVVALELFALMQLEGVQPSERTFVGAIKACCCLAALEEETVVAGKSLKIGCLDKGRSIHSQAVKRGFESNLFVGTSLIDMYAKCGGMVEARNVFDVLPHGNAVSWNAMILRHVEKQEGEVALELYERMLEEGVVPDTRTFVAALKACSMLAGPEQKQVEGVFVKVCCLEKGREIHSHAVRFGCETDVFVGTTLLDMYAKCGSIVDARQVFDSLLSRNVVSWNAMILGCAEKQQGALAFELYARMLQEGVRASERTIVGALKACISLAATEEGIDVGGVVVKSCCLEKGRVLHSRILKEGFESNAYVGNTLIDMYVKCGSIAEARHAFDRLPNRDVVSWTTMISGHAEMQEDEVALQFYARMQREGVVPDDRAFVAALKACTSLAALEKWAQVDGNSLKSRSLGWGRAIHYQVVKSRFESNVFVANTLIDMYVKCGSIVDARLVFDNLPHRNVVSWNCMILGYAEKQEGELALQLYARMQQEGVSPNDRTFVGTLKACGSLAALEIGQLVAGKIVKMQCLEKGRAMHSVLRNGGFESDVYVGTTLVDMYAKCGSMSDARQAFDKLSERDVVSWTAMILGYAEQGESEEAFKLYAQMQEKGVSPDTWTFSSILKACATAAALESGKEIHTQICRAGLETNAIVATALIDMYGKCGSMVDAQALFDALPSRDLVTWSSLIAGYAHQGDCDLVFRLFDRMRQEGIQPNGFTCLSLLTVCTHAGLVDKGKECFKAMSKDYGITPTIEHFTCMVDLLGRAGQMEEAVTAMKEMPLQPNLVTWTTMLGACRKWNNVDIGRRAFECAVSLDGKHAAPYVLMSNIYGDAHMWKERDKIWALRSNAGAWKEPGQSSWTDIHGIVHTFVVGDMKHTESKLIHTKLKDLFVFMEEEGYVPHLGSVVQDISDHEKKDALCGHSEKLAVAYALLKTMPKTTIRVVKNLRICEDCHTAISLISKIEGRNIICRDASRFHDFKDGMCSCRNYW